MKPAAKKTPSARSYRGSLKRIVKIMKELVKVSAQVKTDVAAFETLVVIQGEVKRIEKILAGLKLLQPVIVVPKLPDVAKLADVPRLPDVAKPATVPRRLPDVAKPADVPSVPEVAESALPISDTDNCDIKEETPSDNGWLHLSLGENTSRHDTLIENIFNGNTESEIALEGAGVGEADSTPKAIKFEVEQDDLSQNYSRFVPYGSKFDMDEMEEAFAGGAYEMEEGEEEWEEDDDDDDWMVPSNNNDDDVDDDDNDDPAADPTFSLNDLKETTKKTTKKKPKEKEINSSDDENSPMNIKRKRKAQKEDDSKRKDKLSKEDPVDDAFGNVPSLVETSKGSPEENDDVDFGDYYEVVATEEMDPVGGYLKHGYCKVCNKKLFRKDSPPDEDKEREHMIKFHPNKVWKCKCGFLIVDEARVMEHTDQCGDGKTALTPLIQHQSCQVCGLKFLTPSGYLSKEIRSFWIDHGDTAFVDNHVKYCVEKQKYTSLSKLKSKCDKCKKSVFQTYWIRHHVENHKDSMARCEPCNLWLPMNIFYSHRRRKHRLPAQKEAEKQRLGEALFEFDCEVCEDKVVLPGIVDRTEARRSHFVAHHVKEILIGDCGSYIYGNEEKEQHEKEHEAENVVKLVDTIKEPQCSTCDYGFIDPDGNISQELRYFWFEKNDSKFVQHHIDQCMERRIYRNPRTCKACPEKVKGYQMYRHMIQSHKDQLKPCRVCGQWFLKRSHLNSHMTRKHGTRDRIRPPAPPRKIRLRAPPSSKTYNKVCETCGENFTNAKSYHQHQHQHEYLKKKKEMVKCQYCDKMIKLINLGPHELDHLDPEIPPKKCSFCDKNFNKERLYARHTKTHLKLIDMKMKGPKEKEQCPICHKWITSLKQHHELVHSERVRFPCDECDKTFAEKRHMLRHKTLHTKTFRFNCQYCDKGYNVKCALEYHEDTVHTKVKRYVCPVPTCREPFFVKLYMRRHVKKVHGMEDNV